MIVLLKSTSFGAVYLLGETEYTLDKDELLEWIENDTILHVSITPFLPTLEIEIDNKNESILLSVPDIPCIHVSNDVTSTYFRIPFVKGLVEKDYISYLCLLYTCEYGHNMEQPYGMPIPWIYDLMCQSTFLIKYPDDDKTIYPCFWKLENGELFREEYTCTVIQPAG